MRLGVIMSYYRLVKCVWPLVTTEFYLGTGRGTFRLRKDSAVRVRTVNLTLRMKHITARPIMPGTMRCARIWCCDRFLVRVVRMHLSL